MAKDKKAKGNYELVENPVFDLDLEAGGDIENHNEVASSSDNAHEQSTSTNNHLRSKFDEIATSPARRGFGFKTVKRNKKLFIVLGLAVLIWVAIAGIYSTEAGSNVIDYYKNKVGAIGSDAAEVGNPNSASAESPEGDSDLPSAEDLEYQEQQQKQEEKQEEEAHKVNGEEKPDSKSSKTGEEGINSSDSSNETQAAQQPKSKGLNKDLPITMNDIRSAKFHVFTTDLHFIDAPKDTSEELKDEGLYYYFDRNGVVVEKAGDSSFKKNLISSLDIKYKDKSYRISTFSPNYELTHAIIGTNSLKIFRHSSIGEYWLYDIIKGEATPIQLDDDENVSRLSFAYWSPNYKHISFVHHNDIYIKTLASGKIAQLTKDGSETLLNGRTDWVYEEEVMATDSAIWWSPDEKNVVFMKTDDTKVPKYNIDYYVQSSGGATKYPISNKISYPKPGFENPKVSLHIYSLESEEVLEVNRDDSRLGDDFIVYQVFFVDQETLIIKETDRESNILNIRNYNTKTKESKIIHEVNAASEYDGWIEKFGEPLIIPPSADRVNAGFVDISVVNGYNHLVLFENPSDTEKPRILTEGDWEVSGSSDLAFDKDLNLIYFTANKRSSIDAHIYSVSLESGEIKGLIGEKDPGFYQAIYSSGAKYVSLNYKGPETPYQKMFQVVPELKELTLLSNPTLLTMSEKQYSIPTKKYHRIKVDEYDDGTAVELNVIEILPKNFDKSKKHPLLVHFYAGPGSQVVTSQFDVDFEETIASSLDAVVLYIEPRGTGGQGWKFRSYATKKIGYWEPRDIVKVSSQWLQHDYIDQDRTAVWGWSYGGFTTLKTLEFDAGATFKYGMAVAPVTDWLLYDSIYTERYMDKPENNKEGYEISKITNVENLQKTSRFLIMHGTADDNVHIQNTYSLLDLLTLKNVENYDVHIFPDSEHSIYYHNANPVIYDKLTSWLKDAFEGDFDTLGHK